MTGHRTNRRQIHNNSTHPHSQIMKDSHQNDICKLFLTVATHTL